jgi:hypothetical protein
MGFFHEFVHGCKKVILEEEVRGAPCQRFACPITIVHARFAVTHERQSECSSERKGTYASIRMTRAKRGARNALRVVETRVFEQLCSQRSRQMLKVRKVVL